MFIPVVLLLSGENFAIGACMCLCAFVHGCVIVIPISINLCLYSSVLSVIVGKAFAGGEFKLLNNNAVLYKVFIFYAYF